MQARSCKLLAHAPGPHAVCAASFKLPPSLHAQDRRINALKRLYVETQPEAKDINLATLGIAINLAQLADASVATIMDAWRKWLFAKWAQTIAKWQWLLKVAHRIARNADDKLLELDCSLLKRAITATEQSLELKGISHESISSLKEKLQHAIKAQKALQSVLTLTFPMEPLKAMIEFQDVLGEVFVVPEVSF